MGLAYDEQLTNSCHRLFNNPLLSDVKIKQVSKNGHVREYYAHKAVLGADSHFFYKAFTGNFRVSAYAALSLIASRAHKYIGSIRGRDDGS